MVKALLASAAKSNAADVNARGLTPLAEALMARHLSCADLLLNEVSRSMFSFWDLSPIEIESARFVYRQDEHRESDPTHWLNL